MATHPSQVVFNAWDTYVSGSGDELLFISFDVEAARQDLTDSLPHCARIRIPIHHPNRNGGPVPPESERLYEMEDALCQALSEQGVACRLVGRLTCQGMRELVFQCDNRESFRPAVDAWKASCPDYDVRVAEHEGWTFFDDCIRPSPEDWLTMADQRVIQGLLNAGSDPNKEHALDFVFCGDEAGLRQVAQTLAGRGYEPHASTNFAAGQIVMVKKMVLDAREILDESQENFALAGESGVKYDGWGAAVVR